MGSDSFLDKTIALYSTRQVFDALAITDDIIEVSSGLKCTGHQALQFGFKPLGEHLLKTLLDSLMQPGPVLGYQHDGL